MAILIIFYMLQIKMAFLNKIKQQKWISYVQRCPQMMNFDEEHFRSFVKAYVKLPSVVQNQISSIVFEPDEKDPNKCQVGT